MGCCVVNNMKCEAFAITSQEQTKMASVWHRRLGHFHYQGIRRMVQFGAVRGLPKMCIRNSPCSSCMQGKQSRKSTPKIRTSESTECLQLVHSDVAGPFRVRSLGGAKYFVTFIDDFSKRTWVYFIASKDQVFDKFKLFLHKNKRISGKNVQTLRTDNGGEYVSKAFLLYCANAGILRQFSQPYTPQHNGVAERRNRTILDIVRTFLSDTDVPSHLWAEAVRAAVYIMNLQSSKNHQDKTEELFFGKKPNISHLRIFGTQVYVHQSQPGRSKRAPRSLPHTLLSFDDQVKGYHCYDPIKKGLLFQKTCNSRNPYSANYFDRTCLCRLMGHLHLTTITFFF